VQQEWLYMQVAVKGTMSCSCPGWICLLYPSWRCLA
jgi:hypothetical protein